MAIKRQIAQGIKFGKKPLSLRKSEDECSSDEEELPQSPLKVIAHVETMPTETEPKVGSSMIRYNFICQLGQKFFLI